MGLAGDGGGNTHTTRYLDSTDDSEWLYQPRRYQCVQWLSNEAFWVSSVMVRSAACHEKRALTIGPSLQTCRLLMRGLLQMEVRGLQGNTPKGP